MARTDFYPAYRQVLDGNPGAAATPRTGGATYSFFKPVSDFRSRPAARLSAPEPLGEV